MTPALGWKGTLEEGHGGFTVGNWMLGEVPVTWASRTSPGELMAAAHASCSRELLRDGTLAPS